MLYLLSGLHHIPRSSVARVANTLGTEDLRQGVSRGCLSRGGSGEGGG